MTDINSLIGKYLQSNPTADMSNVIDKMKNIQDSIFEDGWDISFYPGDDGVASEEEFLAFMSKAMGKDSSEIENDVNLLFDILNSESDDDVLTSDELSFDSGFDIWNELSDVGENEINEAMKASTSSSSSDDDLQTTGTSADSNGTSISSLSDSEIADIAKNIADGTASLSSYYGKVSSDDYAAIQAKVEELQSSDKDDTKAADSDNTTTKTTTDTSTDTTAKTTTDTTTTDTSTDTTAKTTNTSTTDTTTVDSVKKQIESIVLSSDSDSYTCPENVIAELETSGIYDADFIAELRNSYTTYSEEDEEKISTKLKVLQMIDPEATREDAIAALQENSEIGEPVTDSKTGLSSAPTGNLTETAVKYDAEKLNDAMKGGFFFGLGTNEEAMEELFNDETLTSSDWVSIMAQYSKEYGSALVSDIDWDYADSSEKQTEYYKKIVDNLLTEIDAGNEDAITVLCQQIYGATAGQTGTADEFMEILFKNIKDDQLYKVYEAYGEATATEDNPEGRDLIEDIEKDYKAFGFIGGTNKTGSGYITQIDKAINKYGREEK